MKINVDSLHLHYHLPFENPPRKYGWGPGYWHWGHKTIPQFLLQSIGFNASPNIIVTLEPAAFSIEYVRQPDNCDVNFLRCKPCLDWFELWDGLTDSSWVMCHRLRRQLDSSCLSCNQLRKEIRWCRYSFCYYQQNCEIFEWFSESLRMAKAVENIYWSVGLFTMWAKGSKWFSSRSWKHP